MSHCWIVVVIFVVIAGIVFPIVVWVCLSAWHQWVHDYKLREDAVGYVVLSAFTVGERHMCPLTPAVHDLPVPAAVAKEARGDGKAEYEFYEGERGSLTLEDILEARANFMDLIFCPSTMGSVLHAIIVATFLCNRGRVLGGGTGQFAELNLKSACLFDRMPGVSRVHEKNTNDAGSGVLPPWILAQIRNSSLRERYWLTLESLPNLRDYIWSIELKSYYKRSIGTKFSLNDDDKNRIQECAVLLVVNAPLVKDEPLICCAIAMPALQHASDIGLLRAAGLMQSRGRKGGFAILNALPSPDEGPDYVSLSDGRGGWRLYSKHKYPNAYFEVAFNPKVRSLSLRNLLNISEIWDGVLPKGCIIKYEQVDETAVVVSRIVNASNAASEAMGWRWILPSSIEAENSSARSDARIVHSGGIVDLLQEERLIANGVLVSELKQSMGFRINCDGCDDSDDDEALVDPLFATLAFRDKPDWCMPDDPLTKKMEEAYLPITSISRKEPSISCYFDSYTELAPMFHLSAALVARFTNYDGVYCVVPLDEASGIPQAITQSASKPQGIKCGRVVKAFLEGKTDLMNQWHHSSTVPIPARRAICKGICLKKDLHKILMSHVKRHYRIIFEQCLDQLTPVSVIESCAYDDPPPAISGIFEELKQTVTANIDDQIAAGEAVRDALKAARERKKRARLDIRNATPSMDDYKRYWCMTADVMSRPMNAGGVQLEILQGLCDHLDLDATGLKAELASRLHEYFQKVDWRARFPTDGGLRLPHWSWAGADSCMTLAERATLAAAEAREEQRHNEPLVAILAPGLRLPWEVVRTIVSYCGARGAAEANEPEEAEEAEEAAAEPVAEADEEPQDARIGARVEVYWELNDTWFRGRIAGQRYKLGVLELLVNYDDGDSEHHPFHEEEFDGHGAPPPAEDGEPVQWRRV